MRAYGPCMLARMLLPCLLLGACSSPERVPLSVAEATCARASDAIVPFRYSPSGALVHWQRSDLCIRVVRDPAMDQLQVSALTSAVDHWNATNSGALCLQQPEVGDAPPKDVALRPAFLYAGIDPSRAGVNELQYAEQSGVIDAERFDLWNAGLDAAGESDAIFIQIGEMLGVDPSYFTGVLISDVIAQMPQAVAKLYADPPVCGD
jgi:hypothetical protein